MVVQVQDVVTVAIRNRSAESRLCSATLFLPSGNLQSVQLSTGSGFWRKKPGNGGATESHCEWLDPSPHDIRTLRRNLALAWLRQSETRLPRHLPFSQPWQLPVEGIASASAPALALIHLTNMYNAHVQVQ
jgi:hypothetical protein